MAIFTGAGVAIVTPMKENGDVNFEKLGELIEEQIARKTDAIIICGTTGESSTLSHEEHLDTIKYAVDKVAKRIPVIAGTGVGTRCCHHRNSLWDFVNSIFFRLQLLLMG